MIQIRNDSRHHVLEVTGHAGGIAGQDVVCASVSCLVLTLAQRCEDLHAEDPRIFREPQILLESGYARISSSASAAGRERLDASWATVVCGLKNISANFPEKVKMGG